MRKTKAIVHISELDLLIPYITYEDKIRVVFEFPNGVMGNFYGACLNALYFFSNIEVHTDATLRFALKVDCIKKIDYILSIDAKIKYLEGELQKVQKQLCERKLLN